MSLQTARISVPSGPAFERSARHGAFALVGDELWLSAPRGIAIRRLPSLERVREIELPERVDGLAVSADARLLAVYSESAGARRVSIRDARSMDVLASLEGDDVIAGRTPRRDRHTAPPRVARPRRPARPAVRAAAHGLVRRRPRVAG
jgi:hypothetical protein